MFTGIITERGEVVDALTIESGRRLTINAHDTSPELRLGDSVSVNGACLTVVGNTDEAFTVEVVQESLDRTTLGGLEVGSKVNLERPMAATGRFDGHIVQGHIDGVGHVTGMLEEGEAVRIRISVPTEIARYMVEKGSITIDGTSLTVTALSGIEESIAWVEVVLIPHTLDVTTLGSARIGSPVNLEGDVIAKYVERLIGART